MNAPAKGKVTGVLVPLSLKRRKALKVALRIACGIMAVFIIAWGFSPWYRIGFNATESLKGYVYVIEKNVVPERGQLVAFWPPKNRFFTNMWFVKYASGVGGDVVTVKNTLFYINGTYIGEAQTHATTGEELRPSKSGVIPYGHFFVSTPHDRSFDSRYEDIGWIPASNIIGRAYRIF